MPQDQATEADPGRMQAVVLRDLAREGIHVRNFGALPSLPSGYYVAYVESLEHYMAFGPNDWAGDIACDPYWCREQAILHAKGKIECV